MNQAVEILVSLLSILVSLLSTISIIFLLFVIHLLWPNKRKTIPISSGSLSVGYEVKEGAAKPDHISEVKLKKINCIHYCGYSNCAHPDKGWMIWGKGCILSGDGFASECKNKISHHQQVAIRLDQDENIS